MRNLTPVILQAGLKEALTEGGIVEAHAVADGAVGLAPRGHAQGQLFGVALAGRLSYLFCRSRCH